MSLIVGASTYCYLYDHSLDTSLERLAAIGFKQLEIMTCPPHVWTRDLDAKARQELRRKIESYGLQVFSSQPGIWPELSLASPNPGIRGEAIRQMKENIQLLHDLGGKVLGTMPGTMIGKVGPSKDQALELARQSISACADDAERLGITIAIENVPRGFVATADDVLQLIQMVGSPAVRATIDVGNANVIEPPLDALERAKEYLAMVHLNDNDGQFEKLPVGQGTIDFGAISNKLLEIGYTRPCILEIVIPGGTDEDFRVSKTALEELGWQT